MAPAANNCSVTAAKLSTVDRKRVLERTGKNYSLEAKEGQGVPAPVRCSRAGGSRSLVRQVPGDLQLRNRPAAKGQSSRAIFPKRCRSAPRLRVGMICRARFAEF